MLLILQFVQPTDYMYAQPVWFHA